MAAAAAPIFGAGGPILCSVVTALKGGSVLKAAGPPAAAAAGAVGAFASHFLSDISGHFDGAHEHGSHGALEDAEEPGLHAHEEHDIHEDPGMHEHDEHDVHEDLEMHEHDEHDVHKDPREELHEEGRFEDTEEADGNSKDSKLVAHFLDLPTSTNKGEQAVAAYCGAPPEQRPGLASLANRVFKGVAAASVVISAASRLLESRTRDLGVAAPWGDLISACLAPPRKTSRRTRLRPGVSATRPTTTTAGHALF